jgi:hypothetical protein
LRGAVWGQIVVQNMTQKPQCQSMVEIGHFYRWILRNPRIFEEKVGISLEREHIEIDSR